VRGKCGNGWEVGFVLFEGSIFDKEFINCDNCDKDRILNIIFIRYLIHCDKDRIGRGFLKVGST
jgi:hypothetical protein